MQNEALREAQLTLEESRDKYADLYEFAPVGYLILTKNAIIEEANLTCTTILGVDRRKLITRRFRTFISDDDLEAWDRYFTSVLRNTSKQVCELNFKKGGGRVISARLESIRLDRDSAKPVIRIALSDITDRVRAVENLVLKTNDLDELNVAYKTIAAGQENLRQNEAKLLGALEEKEVLLSEIHHRVKNNLTAFISLLSLEGSTEETPAGRELKKDLQNRARSMALIHETLYRTHRYNNVDMGIYLTNLLEQIANSFQTSGTVRVIVDSRDFLLDIPRATPAGLIINELVTNSFKYAFPESFDSLIVRNALPTITVTFGPHEGEYVLTVSDNGIGIPPGFDIGTTRTLGLKLVNFLAKYQLNAKIEVNTGEGTEFMFRFREKEGTV